MKFIDILLYIIIGLLILGLNIIFIGFVSLFLIIFFIRMYQLSNSWKFRTLRLTRQIKKYKYDILILDEISNSAKNKSIELDRKISKLENKILYSLR